MEIRFLCVDFNGCVSGLFFLQLLRRQREELMKGKTISSKAHCKHALSIHNKATVLGLEFFREEYEYYQINRDKVKEGNDGRYENKGHKMY